MLLLSIFRYHKNELAIFSRIASSGRQSSADDCPLRMMHCYLCVLWIRMTNRGKSILNNGKMDVNTVSGIMQAEAVNQDAQSSLLLTGI